MIPIAIPKAAAVLAMFLVASLSPFAAQIPGREPGRANPVLPGYYADPSVVRHEGKFFVYATLDPWGGDTLGCWESPDFKHWTYRILNWPTKAACTSPDSGGAAVWAPSVVRGPDGKFHMFVSVGNEVWAGVADRPLGPWRDANGGKPLIPREYKPGFHMIDAEAFVDDDGTPWLYWGSGHNWVNGKCWAVKLNRAMNAFEGEPRDVTPANYFEGPLMVKRHGIYFLTYSQGVTIKDTYQVHYATGDNPLGPFKEGPNSPVLVTDAASNVISPGHHTVFQDKGKDYILYHRHSIPFDPNFIGRQTCVDEIEFRKDGSIRKVTPTHTGPELVHGRYADRLPATASASSEGGPLHASAHAIDNNYATFWRPQDPAQESWLQLDLGKSSKISRMLIRPEFAWKPCRFAVQASSNGQSWVPLVDYRVNAVSGSPVVVRSPGQARYLRLVFPAAANESTPPGVWEWSVFP
jgi:beta-xylosidase